MKKKIIISFPLCLFLFIGCSSKQPEPLKQTKIVLKDNIVLNYTGKRVNLLDKEVNIIRKYTIVFIIKRIKSNMKYESKMLEKTNKIAFNKKTVEKFLFPFITDAAIDYVNKYNRDNSIYTINEIYEGNNEYKEKIFIPLNYQELMGLVKVYMQKKVDKFNFYEKRIFNLIY